MLNDARIIRKEVKEYSRGKDKEGVNLRINIAKQDNLTGFVYIMNEDTFQDYVAKFQEGYFDNSSEVATDTEKLKSVVNVNTKQQTEIITESIDNLKTVINDLYTKLDVYQKDIITANNKRAHAEAKNDYLNKHLNEKETKIKELTIKNNELDTDINNIRNLSKWQLLRGGIRKVLTKE